MEPAPFIASIPVALATAATGWLWRWASLGRQSAGGAAVQHLLRGRFVAASASLGPLTLLAATAPWVASLTHPTLVGLLASGAFCVREALDPLLPGFWHHKRLKPLGLAAAAAGGVVLGLVVPQPELAPLIVAALVFHRHVSGAQGIFTQSLSEIDALARKVQAQDTRLRLDRALLIEAEAVEAAADVADTQHTGS